MRAQGTLSSGFYTFDYLPREIGAYFDAESNELTWIGPSEGREDGMMEVIMWPGNLEAPLHEVRAPE